MFENLLPGTQLSSPDLKLKQLKPQHLSPLGRTSLLFSEPGLADVPLSRFEDTSLLIRIGSAGPACIHVSGTRLRSGQVVLRSCWSWLVLVASDVLEDGLLGGWILVPPGVPGA